MATRRPFHSVVACATHGELVIIHSFRLHTPTLEAQCLASDIEKFGSLLTWPSVMLCLPPSFCTVPHAPPPHQVEGSIKVHVCHIHCHTNSTDSDACRSQTGTTPVLATVAQIADFMQTSYSQAVKAANSFGCGWPLSFYTCDFFHCDFVMNSSPTQNIYI